MSTSSSLAQVGLTTAFWSPNSLSGSSEFSTTFIVDCHSTWNFFLDDDYDHVSRQMMAHKGRLLANKSRLEWVFFQGGQKFKLWKFSGNEKYGMVFQTCNRAWCRLAWTWSYAARHNFSPRINFVVAFLLPNKEQTQGCQIMVEFNCLRLCEVKAILVNVCRFGKAAIE